MSWLAQQAERPREHAESDGDESDEYDQLDRPPPRFLADARALLPQQLQSHFFAAWDKSKGIGEPRQRDSYDPNGPREQAALNFLLGNPDDSSVKKDPALPPPAPRHSSPEFMIDLNQPKLVASGSTTQKKRKRVAFKDSDSEHSDGEIEIVRNGKGNSNRRNGASQAKGKGRERPREVLVLSDEDSDPVVVKRKSPKGKNKVVFFLEASDDDEIYIDDDALEFDRQVDAAMDHHVAKKAKAETPFDDTDLKPPPLARDSPEAVVRSAVASIVAIIPDVDPSHVEDLLRRPLYSGKIDLVLEFLFEGNYPKRGAVASSSKEDQKEVGKAVAEEVDYLDAKSRGYMGSEYTDCALEVLWDTFRTIPKPYIRTVFASSGYYAPTHVRLAKEAVLPPAERSYRTLTADRAFGKGKVGMCEGLEEERAWLRKREAALTAEKELIEAKKRKQRAEAEAGLLIACGCCYTDFCFDDLVQCSEAHLFCKECAVGNAEAVIGNRGFVLPCMVGDGCLFTEAEYKRFLPETSISLLHKIRMEKEVDLAGFEDLAKCPFCPYACVIENAQERLFRCMRVGCEVVSCRECKKVDHLPKSCLEVSEDRIIDNRHTVEEAMTAALMRACPKCSNPYVKESGCNKMSCPNCRTLSCFVCGKIVTGYEHFTNAGTNAKFTLADASCPLWDRPGEREHQAVEAARRAAAAKVGAETEDLKLAAPPPPPANLAHLPRLQAVQAGLGLMMDGARRFIAVADADLEEGRMRMAEIRALNAVNERRRAEEMVMRGREQTAARAAARKKVVAAQALQDDAREAKRSRLTGRG